MKERAFLAVTRTGKKETYGNEIILLLSREVLAGLGDVAIAVTVS